MKKQKKLLTNFSLTLAHNLTTNCFPNLESPPSGGCSTNSSSASVSPRITNTSNCVSAETVFWKYEISLYSHLLHTRNTSVGVTSAEHRLHACTVSSHWTGLTRKEWGTVTKEYCTFWTITEAHFSDSKRWDFWSIDSAFPFCSLVPWNDVLSLSEIYYLTSYLDAIEVMSTTQFYGSTQIGEGKTGVVHSILYLEDVIEKEES